jgi:IS5 family transposase
MRYLRDVMSDYVQPNDPGRFDVEDRLAELQALGDPLQRLDVGGARSLFEPVLAQLTKAQPEGPGGRPASPPLMMFKALIRAHFYHLRDAQMEFQITDRHSFKRSLGLSAADSAPDEKPFWAFREQLTRHGQLDQAFAAFGDASAAEGLLARQGHIVDDTFVEVPRQRNTRAENAQIKAGEAPADWAPEPAKARQKDVAARWAKKGQDRRYGYQNHVNVDSASRLITAFTGTDAAVHDSDALEALVAPGDQVTYADSASVGPRSAAVFERNEVESKVTERPIRNRPLTAGQKRRNRAKSSVWVRVEHVFGTMKLSLRARWNRCIGQVRNAAAITLTNLVYNLVRFEQMERLELCAL